MARCFVSPGRSKVSDRYISCSMRSFLTKKNLILSYISTFQKMRTLKISISELECSKIGIQNEQLTFSDLVDLVSRELSKQALNNSVQLAERFGLSNLTMDNITNEVKAVRKDAKDNH